MEEQPKVRTKEQLWADYGAMLILQELLGVVREDWTGQGTKLWADRRLKELLEDKNE